MNGGDRFTAEYMYTYSDVDRGKASPIGTPGTFDSARGVNFI